MLMLMLMQPTGGLSKLPEYAENRYMADSAYYMGWELTSGFSSELFPWWDSLELRESLDSRLLPLDL